MANWGLTTSDDTAATTAPQHTISPTPSQDLEWGHFSGVYGDGLQCGELSSVSVARDIFLAQHNRQQQQMHHQQALAGETIERCNILSTFFADLMQECVPEEEFARTGPILRQYLQQQQCSALSRAACFLDSNQEHEADAMPAAVPPTADAPYMAACAPTSQLHPVAPPWLPSSSAPDSVGLTTVAYRRGSFSRLSERRAYADQWSPSDPLAAMLGATQEQGFSLRTILKALEHVPTCCVLMAKKFSRLGSNSESALQRHFVTFGVVRHILIPDMNACRRRAMVWQRTGRRRKAANQAFVIMADAAAVDRVLGAQKHLVQGQVVQVTRFEHHDSTESAPTQVAELPSEIAESAGMSQVEEVAVAKCVEKLTGDGYGRQISSASEETTWCHTAYERNISSSSDDDCRSGDGAWMDMSVGSGHDQCEITGDFEYWETDDEGF